MSRGTLSQTFILSPVRALENSKIQIRRDLNPRPTLGIYIALGHSVSQRDCEWSGR